MDLQQSMLDQNLEYQWSHTEFSTGIWTLYFNEPSSFLYLEPCNFAEQNFPNISSVQNRSNVRWKSLNIWFLLFMLSVMVGTEFVSAEMKLYLVESIAQVMQL